MLYNTLNTVYIIMLILYHCVHVVLSFTQKNDHRIVAYDHCMVNIYIQYYMFNTVCMNHHIHSTLFKIQERKSDIRSKEIEQRKESQNTHIKQGRTCDLTALTLNHLAASMA